MNITNHALARCRQRGIPEYLLALIRDLGTKERRPGGAIRRFIKKRECDRAIRELKRMIHGVERLKRQPISIITTEDEDTDTVITAYRKG